MASEALHRRRLIRWAVIPGAWLVYSAIMAVQTHYAYLQVGKVVPWWAGAIVPALLYSMLWMLLTPLVIRLAERFALDRLHRARNIVIHLIASFSLAFIQRVVAEASIMLVRSSELGEGYAFSTGKLFQSVIGYFDYGILIYWVILLVQQALEYARRIQEERLRASRLETQLAKARLEALRTQLHPHFLFNTLNSISALVEEDPATADRMIARLGDFLRLTLASAGDQIVPFERELESLQCYMAIEQVRFQGRLELQLDIEQETLPALVPSFLWQPIVENAIHHGIATSGGTGRIIVRSRSCKGVLRIQVQDNGSGLVLDPANAPQFREGIGLANTRAILQHLYGSEQRFDLANAPGGGAIVTLEIPFTTAQSTVHAYERTNPYDGGR